MGSWNITSCLNVSRSCVKPKNSISPKIKVGSPSFLHSAVGIFLPIINTNKVHRDTEHRVTSRKDMKAKR
jgi:hypothetical protein